MTVLNVYVPQPGSVLSKMIARGSGIVGTVVPISEVGDRIRIDYEGAIYGQANIRTHLDKVFHAADRHVTRYPTVARTIVRPDEVILVGTFDTDTRQLHVTDEPALAEWTGEP